MRLLLDENMSDPSFAARLRARRHDPVLAHDAGLLSASDPRVLIWAIGHALPVLTRNTDDFEDLHELIMAAGGHHPGLILIYFDADPRQRLSDGAIASALSKVESSSVPITDGLHVLNHWR
jgi:hypothetical protein